MKPIRLEMQAFGPYAEKQAIDFREALDAGLFGIYGPTGSGKSSIFSAITFALFGEAAKKEQPIATLRSAHAPPDSLTEVALVFEVGPKRFLIRRQPDQLRPKTRGEGETSMSHSAWLFDVTALDVDAIDMAGCGTVLAERKVSSVGEIVRTILGYGADQFRQIVLLPQGRFERFLTANSTERLTILRELFDVSLYRKLTEQLKEEAAEARRAVSDGYRVHGQRLHAEGFASAEDLDAAINRRASEAAIHADAAGTADLILRVAEQSLSQGQAVESQFIERERADQRLLALQQQQAGIAAEQARRDNARLAQRATDMFAGIAMMTERQGRAAAHVQQTASQLEGAIQALASADKQLADAALAAQNLEALQQRTYALQGFAQALQGALDLKARADTATQTLEEVEYAASTAATERDRLRDAQEAAAVRRTRAQHHAIERAQQQQAQTSVEANLAAARAYHRAVADLAAARTRHAEADAIEARAADAHSIAERRSTDAEAAFIAAQSSLLALRLIDGQPCPVCGGADHPSPAHGEGDPRALEAAWKLAREQASQAADTRRAALIETTRVASLIQEREEQLGAVSSPASDMAELEGKSAQIAAALERLGAPEELDQLAQQSAQIDTALASAIQHAEQQEAERQRARTAAALAAQSYADQIGNVPEALRNPQALAAELNSVTTRIEGLRTALSHAQAAVQQARSDKASAEAAHVAAVVALDAAKVQLAEAQAQFAHRLEEVGISAEQYAAFASDIPAIEALSERVANYERGLRQAEGAASQAAAQLIGLARPQLEALQQARNQAHDSTVAARQLAAAAEEIHRGLVRLKNDLATELARLVELERETGALRMIAEACTGQNEANITLEAYAIGTMFDIVLDAANLRLEPMTSGRYRLERDSETNGGRSKRGLDIKVNDIQTGRARDLSTLSGGEAFIAALALALGLSDVVENSQGAIRLDTIFIDEGFGSLDTENDSGTLEVVLDVLQNIVGQRRAVGLISHVPLVQQAVPNGFVIVKGLAGSTIEQRIS